MPKVNVYLPDSLAAAARQAGLPISEICQRALTVALGEMPPAPAEFLTRRSPMTTQSIEERQDDLHRAADAVRYALDPDPVLPARLKPIGAATVAGLIRSTIPAYRDWENKAQEVAGYAAALELLEDLGAPGAVKRVAKRRLEESRDALSAIELPETLGPPREVLDLLAELSDRSHPIAPR